MRFVIAALFIFQVIIIASCGSASDASTIDGNDNTAANNDNASVSDNSSSDNQAKSDSDRAASDSSNDSSKADSDSMEASDADDNQQSDELADNDSDTQILCGNGFKDWNEVCDGDSRNCADIDAELYSGGVAPCSSSCSTYDVTACEYKKIFTFQFHDGGTAYDDGLTVIQTEDGGYIAAGYTQSFVGNNITPDDPAFVMSDGDMYMIKLNYKGEKVWERHFGGSYQETAYSIIKANDGGFIIAGEKYIKVGTVITQNQNYDKVRTDGYAVKIDEEGAVLWEKNFGDIENQESFYDVAATSDGGYIFAGSVDFVKAEDKDKPLALAFDKKQIYLVKTDNSGNKQWEKIIGGPNEKLDYATRIVRAGDNYYISGATRSFDAGMRDFYLGAIKENGDIIFQKNLPGTGDDFAEGIQVITDAGGTPSGVALIGIDDYYWEMATNDYRGDIRLVKAGLDGAVVLDKTYDMKRNTDDFSVDWGRDIITTATGGFILTASAGYDIWTGTADNSDLLVMELDASGSILWQKRYGKDTSYDFPGQMKRAADGGLIIIGSTQSFNTDKQDDFYILKLDKTGGL